MSLRVAGCSISGRPLLLHGWPGPGDGVCVSNAYAWCSCREKVSIFFSVIEREKGWWREGRTERERERERERRGKNEKRERGVGVGKRGGGEGVHAC